MKASKARSHFVCGGCGATEPRWTGRCKVCSAWNSMVEEEVVAASPRGLTGGGGWNAGGRVASHGAEPEGAAGPLRSQSILEVDESASGARRLRSGLPALDRVLARVRGRAG